MAPTGHAYNTDWVFSNNSNVHVANHRDWFTSFTPFQTHLDPSFCSGDSMIKVLGIGDVILPVKIQNNRHGRSAQSTLILKDVLYAPSVVCNILGGPILDTYDCALGRGKSKLLDRVSGACVGLLDNNKLYRLRLKGQSAHQTSLDKDSAYLVRATWSAEEHARYEAHKANLILPASASRSKPSPEGTENAPYSPIEKRWLKVHYGGEYEFLRVYGLSIFKEEERAAGRRMVRAFIRDEVPMQSEALMAALGIKSGSKSEDNVGEGDDDSPSDGSDDESNDSFLEDLERDPMSHLADSHFSGAELQWIKKHWGYSAKFLHCYGLKPYEDEDCQEGKAILRALVENDV